MSKELHPICFYVNDREEMLNQMFSTMKEDKFRAMLPPVLKGMEVDELKKYCLEELLGMSSKRIHSIVAGRELLSSSDSEDLELSASDNEESPSANDSDSDSSASGPPKSRRVSKDVRTDDTLQIAISSEEVGDLLEESTSRKPDEAKRPHVKAKRSKAPQVAKVNGQAAAPEKTLLEMLELELRARAIRAALTHQEKINLVDNRPVADTGIVIEIKEESVKATNNASEAARASRDPSNEANNKDVGVAKTVASTKDSDVEIVCEEISSDEAMFSDPEDGEPEVIEPVIESIVISSDSEPEKPEEKQESWKERWMQKKDISSVMKASKLITNVKRKMKRDKTDKIALAQAAQEAQEKPKEITPPPPTTIIQGTVSEFNLLPPATTSLATVVEQPLTGQSATEQTPSEQSVVEQTLSEQSVVEQTLSEHLATEQTPTDQSPSEQSVIEQTLSEHLATEQTPTDQSPSEQSVIKQTSVEPSVAEQVNIDQPVEDQMPVKQPTAELSQESQQLNQPMAIEEECTNDQMTTNTILGKTASTQETMEASQPLAEIVEESITTQATALLLSECAKRNENSVNDFQDTSVNSLGGVGQDMLAITSLPAVQSCSELPHIAKSVTEQPMDEGMRKPVKRKKKSKKGDKIVKSQVKKVLQENLLATTVSREQSNVDAPQLNESETTTVTQHPSRKELKEAKREKKSKGDKIKRPRAKKMQSAVSIVSVAGASSSTAPKVSPRKQFVTNDSKIDVTEPFMD